MTAIFDFLTAIADGIIGIVEFMASLIADTLYVVQLTANAISQIPQYLAFIPGPVLAIILSMLTVAVVYKVLGRE